MTKPFEIAKAFAIKSYSALINNNFDNLNITDHLYDLSIIPAVYYYYSTNSHADFQDFYQSYLTDEYSSSNSFTVFSNALSLLKDKHSYVLKHYSLSSDWELIGDLHSCITKAVAKDSICYNNLLNVESLLNELSKISPIFSSMIPHTRISNGIVTRPYLSVYSNNINLPEYYFNFGKLISFALYFRAIDLHYENILIRDQRTPHVFDWEFLFTPRMSKTPYSIHMTGLLSSGAIDNASALLAGFYEINSYLKPILNLDDYRKPEIKWIVPSKRTLTNIPNKNDLLHPYKEIDSLIKGYKVGVQELLQMSASYLELVKEMDLRIRVLVRPTRVYRYLILKSTYPQFAKNTSELNSKLLADLSKIPVLVGCRFAMTKLLNSEMLDLKSASIPYFYMDVKTNELLDSRGEIVGRTKTIPISYFERYVKTFKSRSDKELSKIRYVLKRNYESYLNKK